MCSATKKWVNIEKGKIRVESSDSSISEGRGTFIGTEKEPQPFKSSAHIQDVLKPNL